MIVSKKAVGAGVVGALAVTGAGVGVASCPGPQPAPPPTAITVPASIPSDCSADATAGLNAWLPTVPANATVDLAAGACYLVSNSNSSLLNIAHTTGLTVNGNGATFEQKTYDATGDPKSPVVTLANNSGLSISNVTLKGPGTSGGSSSEGDAGVLMYQNTGVTLSGMTISGLQGDGIDLYQHGNDPGVNTNIVVESSTITPGYHALVPEAVKGFTFGPKNTVTNGDIDAEVDFSCQANPADCGTVANPSVGIVDMTIIGNSFPSGLQLLDGASCIPVANWKVENNDTGTGGLKAGFNTTYSLSLSALQACGQYDGLTITGNTSSATTLKPIAGSGSPDILVQGWKNVTIANNQLVLDPSQGAPPIGAPWAELWGDSGVNIANNGLAGYYNVLGGGAPAGWPANTNVTVCGNVHLGAPEAACS